MTKRTPARARVASGLPIVLVPHPHVRVDASVLGGSPHVVGSRVPVRRLFAFHRSGASVETIMKRYPKLGAAKVLDSLAFALDNPEVIEADLDREALLMQKTGQSVSGVADARQFELRFEEPAREAARPASRSSPKKTVKTEI